MPIRLCWHPLILTTAASAVLLTPLCGLWFSCGCDWPWAGLHRHCNALVTNAPKPHCPWCVDWHLACLAIGFASLAALSAVIHHPTLRRGGGAAMLYAAASGTLVFTLALAASAWVTALWTRHPTFLGMPLS